ncbi:MAG: carbohydrate kinase family protein [Ardenticatenaceae bacterium]|nr:carbohydrate kinase family protein [Ardenticatenaceae bacterium]MCB9446100.1 carbohydrate kinase family protein [Ardenticatenaceae bacterium]
MDDILISGLINIETTLKVDAFPLTYEPVRYPFFGINSTVSGVGYNIAKALTVLDNQIRFSSLIGSDFAAGLVRQTLAEAGIDDTFIVTGMPHTAQSVIIYNRDGQRQIHTDLKDIQERPYPSDLFTEAIATCSLAILCNINFNRPFLQRARQTGKIVATDVHTIADLDDEYNRDYMAAANILFMSDERLPCSPEEWARRLQNRYGTEIIVIGLGSEGALLAVRDDHFMERIPAVQVRSIVSTIGAGDALFSAFIHVYHRCHDPHEAIKKAVLFAGYKIGTAGAADGFLNNEELEALARQY